jgi:hypothetical protein
MADFTISHLNDDPERVRKRMQQAKEIRAAQLAAWSKLDLRQTWRDERWMRAHLVRAGIRVASNLEPATPKRVRQLCRRAGITEREIQDAVGLNSEQYLKRNPRLPVWAAVALIVELTGRFTPSGSEAEADEQDVGA